MKDCLIGHWEVRVEFTAVATTEGLIHFLLLLQLFKMVFVA